MAEKGVKKVIVLYSRQIKFIENKTLSISKYIRRLIDSDIQKVKRWRLKDS